MCPHTCSRLSVPSAKRLKYSELRKGLCASSSAVSASNQSSVVMTLPPSRRPARSEVLERRGPPIHPEPQVGHEDEVGMGAAGDEAVAVAGTERRLVRLVE